MKKEYKKKWETQLKMNLLIGWVQSFIWNLQDKKIKHLSLHILIIVN